MKQWFKKKLAIFLNVNKIHSYSYSNFFSQVPKCSNCNCTTYLFICCCYSKLTINNTYSTARNNLASNTVMSSDTVLLDYSSKFNEELYLEEGTLSTYTLYL